MDREKTGHWRVSEGRKKSPGPCRFNGGLDNSVSRSRRDDSEDGEDGVIEEPESDRQSFIEEWRWLPSVQTDLVSILGLEALRLGDPRGGVVLFGEENSKETSVTLPHQEHEPGCLSASCMNMH